MPTLNWISKEAVVKHHSAVPFRLLEPVPELSCSPRPQGEGPGVRASGNLIVQGDNPTYTVSPLLGVHEGRAIFLLYNGILKDKSGAAAMC